MHSINQSCVFVNLHKTYTQEKLTLTHVIIYKHSYQNYLMYIPANTSINVFSYSSNVLTYIKNHRHAQSMSCYKKKNSKKLQNLEKKNIVIMNIVAVKKLQET